jgi:biotin operon repressor
MPKQNTAIIITNSLNVLLSIKDKPPSTRQDLAIKHKKSKASITRNINLLRSLGVKVEWNVKQRVYEIWDWGIFDPDKVKGLVGDI